LIGNIAKETDNGKRIRLNDQKGRIDAEIISLQEIINRLEKEHNELTGKTKAGESKSNN